MVTVTGYNKRTKANGEVFFTLALLGGVEAHVSKSSGKPYLTARKANMISPFDEQTCKSLIGSKLPGQIEKQECEPYSYTIPSSGETVELNYTYTYNPEPASMEEHVFAGEEPKA